MKRLFAMLAGSVLVLGAGSAVSQESDSLGPWLAAHVGFSTDRMFANIGPSPILPKVDPGAVVASPSLVPYYRYHWIRDGALTMGTVLGLYARSKNADEQSRYLKTLMAYAEFSRRNQLTPNPSGEADGAGLGEPKFNLDGTAFTDPWGRPQNDGPALRALTLGRLAGMLLDRGQLELVRTQFYDSALPTHSVVKADLEFVAHHWQETSFDLWEEVRGKHFYTQMVQRRALLEGAGLAERLGDAAAASFYREQALGLEAEISKHWDAAKGFITATLSRVGGLRDKTSGLDVAVVLGVLHGAGTEGDAFFAVTDDRVLATAQKLDEAFHRIYAINAITQDDDHLPLGNAIGRYPEDVYSGNGPQNLGSPWFLATNALAEFYYRAADAFERQGSVTISNVNAPFFKAMRKTDHGSAVVPGQTWIADLDPQFEVIAQGLRDRADAYLRRVKFHADGQGALSEQFNRDTGYMQSAVELTWSHASLLTAAWAKEQAAWSARFDSERSLH